MTGKNKNMEKSADYGKYMNLRIDTYKRLRCLSGKNKPQRHHLIALLGYRHHIDRLNFNERDANICKMLLGPHGFTIYKALRAQHGK